MKKLSLTIIIAVVASIITACIEETYEILPEDTRLWTHEQLMRNAWLQEPDNTDGLQIVYLEGDDYRIGYQHATLIKDQILESLDWILSDPLWGVGLVFAETYLIEGKTIFEWVEMNTYDSIKDQCEAMVEVGEDMVEVDFCLTINSINYVLEHIMSVLPVSYECSGFAAANEATVDGKLLHGRNLDWDAMKPIIDYPTLFIVNPDDGYTYANIGWPAWASVLTGINEHGISVELNEDGTDAKDLYATPHIQLLLKVLREASTLDEAIAIIEAADHGTAELFLIADGKTNEAIVVETNAEVITYRRLYSDGTVKDSEGTALDYENVIMVTNHSEDPAMEAYQKPSNLENMNNNSVARYTRLLERLTGKSRGPYASLGASAYNNSYGNIDVEEAISILRDPTDMRDRTAVPCNDATVYHSVGNNHNVMSMVFVPEDLHLWLATGEDEECGTNVLYNPFIGYDLNELFAGKKHTGSLPIYDPDYTTY